MGCSLINMNPGDEGIGGPGFMATEVDFFFPKGPTLSHFLSQLLTKVISESSGHRVGMPSFPPKVWSPRPPGKMRFPRNAPVIPGVRGVYGRWFTNCKHHISAR